MSLMVLVRYEFFNGEISDNPIVDDDYKLSVMTGLLYHF
jgi:outer membrane scaffolding protein for murein synthesis (MipA/OmpV family)